MKKFSGGYTPGPPLKGRERRVEEGWKGREKEEMEGKRKGRGVREGKVIMVPLTFTIHFNYATASTKDVMDKIDVCN